MISFSVVNGACINIYIEKEETKKKKCVAVYDLFLLDLHV